MQKLCKMQASYPFFAFWVHLAPRIAKAMRGFHVLLPAQNFSVLCRCSSRLKQIAHVALQNRSNLGQKHNVRVAFYSLPFGNGLTGDSKQLTEFLLGQVMGAAVFPNFLGN